jgi:hypothetical protein
MRNVKLVLIHFLIIFPLYFNTTCRKHPIITIKLNINQKNWFFIDTGSYYIYADSLNNFDSVYVISSDLVLEKKSDAVLNETYKCVLSNGIVFYMLGNDDHLYLKKTLPIEYVPIILYDRAYSKNKNISANELMVSNIRDTIMQTFSQANLNYDSTIVWTVFPDMIMNSKKSRYNFSKGIGIVGSYNFEKSTFKKLVKYKLNKKS